MTKQADILEGVARNAYLWKSFLIEGSNSIEPFDKLTEEERKPYYVLAGQLMIYLDEEGVVIKAPMREITADNLVRDNYRDEFTTVQPLIEEAKCQK